MKPTYTICNLLDERNFGNSTGNSSIDIVEEITGTALTPNFDNFLLYDIHWYIQRLYLKPILLTNIPDNIPISLFSF